jgi:hypothetical protein
MARRIKKLINKKVKKHLAGKCKFCPCNVYEFLDVHRITEGNQGGKYTDQNTVVVCRKCHQKIHEGKILIDKQYQSISGNLVLHYFIDGNEYWE